MINYSCTNRVLMEGIELTIVNKGGFYLFTFWSSKQTEPLFDILSIESQLNWVGIS